MLPVLKGYTAEKGRRDFWAGLTVALFTIPQAMAYALIAGMPPSAGIATAVVASILGAVFGSSEFLINGPTNAISVMIASNVALLGGQGDPHRTIVLLTLMIGVGQLIASALRAGSLVRFISEPVLVGFTAGAGLYVAINQFPSALGLEKSSLVKELWGWKPPSIAALDLVRTALSVAQANWAAIAIAAVTFVLVRLLQRVEKRFKQRIPAPFLTVVAVSVAVWALGLGEPEQGLWKVKLVRDIEPVTRALPRILLPQTDISELWRLLPTAFAIGLLGAVEAIAISKALASRVGHRFSANAQLVGEGACNVGAALVGGFAASGSFTRTAVNFESGAVTRMSAILSGLLILGIVLLFAPLANYIPIAVLAGMLIHVGLKLVNVAKVKMIMESTPYDRRAVIYTFFAVLLLPDLAYALFFGVGLSVYGALRRAEGFKLLVLEDDGSGHLVERPLEGYPIGDVVALDLQGELFFAAAEEVEQRLKALYAGGAKVIVLRLQQAYNMDVTCAEALSLVARNAREAGGRLVLSGVRPGMYGTLRRARAIEEIGPDAVFEHQPTLLGATRRAIEYAHELARTGKP